MDDVESDLKKMEVKRWKEKTERRPRLTQCCSADWQACKYSIFGNDRNTTVVLNSYIQMLESV
jgi:hypothetical protein